MVPGKLYVSAMTYGMVLLFGAEFLGSVFEGTKLHGANLRMTKLA